MKVKAVGRTHRGAPVVEYQVCEATTGELVEFLGQFPAEARVSVSTYRGQHLSIMVPVTIPIAIPQET